MLWRRGAIHKWFVGALSCAKRMMPVGLTGVENLLVGFTPTHRRPSLGLSDSHMSWWFFFIFQTLPSINPSEDTASRLSRKGSTNSLASMDG